MLIPLPITSHEVQQGIIFNNDHLRVRCRHQHNTVAGGHCRKCMEMEERRLLRNRQKARDRRKGRKSKSEDIKVRIKKLEQMNAELRVKNERIVQELTELDAPLVIGPFRSGQGGVEDAMLNLALLKRTEETIEPDVAVPESKRESSAVTTSPSNTASTSNCSPTEPSLSTYRGDRGVSTFHFRSPNN